MITKMKKLTALVYHREYEQFLKELQQLGVVHVQPAQEGMVATNSQLQQKMQEVQHVQAVIETLKPLCSNPESERKATADISNAGQQAMAQYEQLLQQKQQQEQRVAEYESQVLQYTPWGEYDQQGIDQLADAGRDMYFFHTSLKTFRSRQDEWNEQSGGYVFPIHEEKGNVWFVLIAPCGQHIELEGANTLPKPQHTAAESTQLLAAEKEALCGTEQQMAALANAQLSNLEAYEAQLRSNIQFDQAKLDTAHAADDMVMILEGWVPVQMAEKVTAFLGGTGAYFQMRDPVKTDNVPILLRNNWFTRMYEVLTEMYGMPDYNEFDPTPIVAPFFTLFFSYCIADAGYGLVLILLGLLLKKKLGESMKGMMNLVITLGIATTILGAVFGTFFGVNLVNVNLPEWMKGLMITGKVGDTVYDKTMLLSLIIGVIHIIIAMTVKAVKSTVLYGFKQSITAWSWLLLIVGFICVGGLNFLKVISTDVSTIAFYVVGGIAAVGIFLLNDLKRNPLINIGAGLWDTYGMASGLLGDVLSYVRIYALGLAGGMLGGVFNTLAMMTKGDSWWGWIPCILILVFGHTLNIAMSCLGAFVHPLRLNFVEYFKNSNYEGTGTAYAPLHIAKAGEE